MLQVRHRADDKDRLAHRKGQKYMTVVVDHDSRRVVWMADGHGKDVPRCFFDALGERRAHRLTHISADGAQWIAEVVAERAPNAIRAMDPFHVAQWATDALDEERRVSWNRAREHAADPELARRLKHSRHALWKNPEVLTPRQQAKLAWIATTDPRPHRAYLLKEGLRTIYRIAADEGVSAAAHALDPWLSWAARCRIPVFTQLAKKIRRHYDAILHAIAEQLSNGLIESTNTKTRLIIRRGFGFRNAEAIIALVMLCLGGNRPDLPRRQLA